jgi:hypothetical protein
VASFSSNTYNFDPLLADECLSKSGKIGPGQGILKRGTVLGGVAAGSAPTGVTPFVYGNSPACCILAQDIDTGTGAAVTGLVYTQGKFLDTGMIFSANGAATDVAQLWNVGIYVLTVEQRSGLLVPLMNLPTTGAGPLPQQLTPEEARKASKDQVEAIRAAIDAALPPGAPFEPDLPRNFQDPAWAVAAFGDREQSKEEAARDKAAESALDLRQKQLKSLSEVEAKHARELADLHHRLHEERAQHAKQTEESIRQAKGNSAPPSQALPKK